ncbi:MAG: acyl-CoA dehydrogenase family protein [Xanthomonadales bacterium]|nr:acyl-CoA dehydrogenase family protein [Xanthomonadales bacterium]
MDLGISDKLQPILAQVRQFISDEILPLEDEYLQEVGVGDRWQYTDRQAEILESLKARARDQGLWNFFLTHHDGGHGLNTVEYAYIAEETGKSHLAPEVFNCSAPDTGNMEVLARYGTEQQKGQWLKPLLAGEIRSAYVMTEPDEASSDATNISMSCVRDGEHYVLNGDKIWISGAGDPRCRILIVMCRSNPEASRHSQHSQILVPMDTSGVEVLRPMLVFGGDDAPHGHMHMRFTDVRVPVENIILGEGRGFEVAQGRLGPGRIHHCMRAIGMSESALELLCKRSVSRKAFGRPLAKLGANYDIIANCRMDIEMARLLCLKTAWMMDEHGVDAAQHYISMIKSVAPNVAQRVLDEAIQMHGGQGVSQDTPLAHWYAQNRTLRFADGPDAVHRMVVARRELKRYL